MPSQYFEQFYESCFDKSFGIVRNGVNEKAILNLQGDELKEAERLLLQSLGTDKDSYSRPVIALGILRSKEAVEPLKKRLETAAGIDRIQIALALFRIENYPEAESIIIDCLKIVSANRNDETTRWSAVEALPNFGKTTKAVQALLEAMIEDNMTGQKAARLLRTLFIDDEPVRNLLGQILLNRHDVHKPDFISRSKLVGQADELINARLKEGSF
jgi:HEAT repeat protein